MNIDIGVVLNRSFAKRKITLSRKEKGKGKKKKEKKK